MKKNPILLCEKKNKTIDCASFFPKGNGKKKEIREESGKGKTKKWTALITLQSLLFPTQNFPL